RLNIPDQAATGYHHPGPDRESGLAITMFRTLAFASVTTSFILPWRFPISILDLHRKIYHLFYPLILPYAFSNRNLKNRGTINGKNHLDAY
ncbi:MAG TPA: hypothetical protein PKV71_17640, partial [Calditrichia bacterium]|nr:hypothetical protein [Calditrichia bacterium]